MRTPLFYLGAGAFVKKQNCLHRKILIGISHRCIAEFPPVLFPVRHLVVLPPPRSLLLCNVYKSRLNSDVLYIRYTLPSIFKVIHHDGVQLHDEIYVLLHRFLVRCRYRKRFIKGMLFGWFSISVFSHIVYSYLKRSSLNIRRLFLHSSKTLRRTVPFLGGKSKNPKIKTRVSYSSPAHVSFDSFDLSIK